MRNIISFTVIFFFSFNFLNAQAWAKNGTLTEGAKIALYRVWGQSMGFSSPEETAREAKKIYDSGKFENKFVMNSGVTPKGEIVRLGTGTFSVVYLGSTDGEIFGHPKGVTVNLYLKKDCMNLDWVVIKPQPKTEEVPVKENVKIVQETIYVQPSPAPVQQVVQQEQACTCWRVYARKSSKHNYGNRHYGTDNNYIDQGETHIGYFTLPAGETPVSSRQRRWEQRPMNLCRDQGSGEWFGPF
ncbi:MAG: hypothetical protein WC011_02280 [Candidatus Paceibacterota bacterium]